MVRVNIEEDREAIMARFLVGFKPRDSKFDGITTLCEVGGQGAYGYQD